jgi:hypothetical protein
MTDQGPPVADPPAADQPSRAPQPLHRSASRTQSAREDAWREGSQGWNALSYLVGGALLGTVAGSLAVKVTGFTTFFPASVLLGLALAGYVIWVRYARP